MDETIETGTQISINKLMVSPDGCIGTEPAGCFFVPDKPHELSTDPEARTHIEVAGVPFGVFSSNYLGGTTVVYHVGEDHPLAHDMPMGSYFNLGENEVGIFPLTIPGSDGNNYLMMVLRR